MASVIKDTSITYLGRMIGSVLVQLSFSSTYEILLFFLSRKALDAASMSQVCFRYVSIMILLCSEYVSSVLQLCFKYASSMFSSILQVCFQ